MLFVTTRLSASGSSGSEIYRLEILKFLARYSSNLNIVSLQVHSHLGKIDNPLETDNSLSRANYIEIFTKLGFPAIATYFQLRTGSISKLIAKFFSIDDLENVIRNINQSITNRQPILLEGLIYAPLLAIGERNTIVINTIDAISLRQLRLVENSKGLAKVLSFAKYLGTRYLEKKFLPNAKRVLVVSPVDAEYYKRRIGLHNVSNTGLIVEESYFDYDTTKVSKSYDILVLGNMDIPYIRNGFLRFFAHCADLVKARDIKIGVVGRSSSQLLSSLDTKGMQLENSDWVDNYVETACSARLILLLDETGTGLKSRVAQIMTLGIPLVGTAPVFEGFDESCSAFCVVSQSPEEAGISALELLDNEAEQARMKFESRQFAKNTFSRHNVLKNLNDLLSLE